jgi:NAD(P)-dependent dehydrogenase (short-subunit alcohol dehydrogenase family)
MRNLDKAEPLRTAAKGMDMQILRLDVTVPASRDKVISEVLARHGQIDVLINNAGLCSLDASEVLGEGDLRALFETNVFGAFSLIMAVLPAMRARRSGRIVNVTSVASFMAPQFMTGYAATKHALDAISVGMDLELKDFDVRVTSVAPAAYGTSLGENVPPPTVGTPYSDEAIKRYEAFTATMDGRTDISPVVEAIVEAATTADPKQRYLVTPAPPPFAAIVDEKERFDEARRATG